MLNIYDLLTYVAFGFLVLRMLQGCQYHLHCPLMLDPADRSEIDFQEQRFFPTSENRTADTVNIFAASITGKKKRVEDCF